MHIWNYARTEAKINATLEGSETDLIAYYNFEDGSGSVLTDVTGNEYNGTLQNMEE